MHNVFLAGPNTPIPQTLFTPQPLEMKSQVWWTRSGDFISQCASSSTSPLYCLTFMESIIFPPDCKLLEVRGNVLFIFAFPDNFSPTSCSKQVLNTRMWTHWPIHRHQPEDGAVPLDSGLLFQFVSAYRWQTQKRSFRCSETWSESAEHNLSGKVWYIKPDIWYSGPKFIGNGKQLAPLDYIKLKKYTHTHTPETCWPSVICVAFKTAPFFLAKWPQISPNVQLWLLVSPGKGGNQSVHDMLGWVPHVAGGQVITRTKEFTVGFCSSPSLGSGFVSSSLHFHWTSNHPDALWWLRSPVFL